MIETIDSEGTVLANVDEARAEAIVLSGAMLRDAGGKFWNNGQSDRLTFGRRRLSKLWPTIPPAAPLLNSTAPDAGLQCPRILRLGR